MNIFQKLFNATLEPTERERLERSPVFWIAEFKREKAAHRNAVNKRDDDLYLALTQQADLEAENRRLQGHIDNNRALFAEIHAQGVNSTSGTAQSMAAKAKAGLPK